jgi:hypothetical protein
VLKSLGHVRVLGTNPTKLFFNVLPTSCYFMMNRIRNTPELLLLFTARLSFFLCKRVGKREFVFWIRNYRYLIEASQSSLPHRVILYPNIIGFAMLCAGAVRRKNVQNTMLKNLLDAVSSHRIVCRHSILAVNVLIFFLWLWNTTSVEHRSRSTLLDLRLRLGMVIIRMDSSGRQSFS